ncbi:MAG: YhbY family RNA-binding protein [Alkaliphilus sp.]
MITGKQRSFLKKIAHNEKPITQLGKSGITDSFIEQLEAVLEAREIIKISILESSSLDAAEACREVAERTNSEFVQAIGNKFSIYRRARDKENRKIRLPK